MVDRETLVDAILRRDVEAMDLKDLVRFAYDVFEERFESYSDEDLREHASHNYPELLEELDNVSDANQ